MEDSSGLLEDLPNLKARFDRDGCLLIRGLVDSDAVLALHEAIVSVLSDEPGFGVTISTSSLMRSSQPVMPFGLPGRTAMTTTEVDTMPLLGPAFQVSATRPSLKSPSFVCDWSWA